MGAFETFVNANLGIRKPLISDLGLPSGSSKAAGIVGSQYIDEDTNFLYEKTGENNSQDWAFVRELGVSNLELSQNVSSDLFLTGQNLQSQLDSLSSSTFSKSIEIPSGAGSIALPYLDVGASGFYPSAQACVTIRHNIIPASMYSCASYNFSPTGFFVAFSDDIAESGLFLDVMVNV